MFIVAVEAATDHRDLSALSFLGLKKANGENQFSVGCFENYGVAMLVSFQPCDSGTCSEQMVVEGAKKNG